MVVVVAGCTSASLPCRVPSFLTTLAPTQTVIPQYMAAVITAVSSSLSMFSFLLFLLMSYSAPRDSDLPGPLSARHWYVPRLPQCEFLPLCFFSSFVFLGSTGLCFLWFLWLFIKEASSTYDLNKDFPKIVFLLWTASSSESTLGSGETPSSWVVLLASVPSCCCCMHSIDGTSPGTLDSHHFHTPIQKKKK